MTVTTADNRYSNFVFFLLLSFPVLISSVKVFGNLILLIFFFLGSYIFITEKRNPFIIPELKILSWVTVSYFIVMMASMVIADGLSAQFHHLGRKLHFLLAPFIALSIYDSNLSIEHLLRSLKFGLILISIIVLVQFFFLGHERPSGMFNANVFSDIVVAMFFLSIVRFFEETRTEKFLSIIAVLIGIIPIVLSASRGSWLSFLILFLVYFVITSSRFTKDNRKRIFGLILLITVLVLGFSQLKIVKEGINTAFENTQSWQVGDTNVNSTSLRLEMWRSGFLAAADSPLFGYGYRNANEAVLNYARQNHKEIGEYTHLHNEYLTNLVSAGLIGLISLFFLLFAPLIVFVKKLRNDRYYHYALMGILLCVAYITFGFTHIAFGEEHMNAFYIFFLCLLLPRMKQSNLI